MTESGNGSRPAADADPRSRIRGRDVFILGAGFSKAVAAEMPTMSELGAEVRARLADNANLASAIPASMGDNIELWMTYLSQPQPWLREPDIDLHRSLGGRIRLAIADIIEERTELASASDAPSWLRQLVMAWHLRQATIITLNYDTLVERVARDLKVSEKQGPFHPTDLYPPYFANVASRSGAGLWGGEDPHTFRLLKLHGSVNWHYSGRENFHGETIFFSDVPEFGPAADEARRDAMTRRLRDMAADKETLLIPPVAEKTTYFSNETVRALWKDASAALRNAAALHVVGYSLPMSDLGMQFFLAGNSPDADAPVHVVDINTGVPDRFREFLKSADVRDGYVGMEDPVVLFAGDYAASAME
ncbi:MAG: SIR2 family protein [Rhodospirillaceae bacterium]|nr:SIR2 family protein [Rhodospirillaceae bacterium]